VYNAAATAADASDDCVFVIPVESLQPVDEQRVVLPWVSAPFARPDVSYTFLAACSLNN